MNTGFILGQYFADLLKKASNNQIPQNLLDFAGWSMDMLLIIAIVVAIVGVIYQLIKFGIRKVNGDSTTLSKDERIAQRKDVFKSVMGFAIVIGVCLLIPSIFAIVTSLIGI